MPDAVKTIAKALQVYGAYVNDRGGSVSIQGENGLGRGYNPWTDKIGNLTAHTDYIPLDTLNPPFPLDKLSVLKFQKNTGQGTCPYPFP